MPSLPALFHAACVWIDRHRNSASRASSKALREPNPRAPRQTPALFPSCLAGPKSSRSTWSSEAPLLVAHPFLKCRAFPNFCPEMPAKNAKCPQGIYSALLTFGWCTSTHANTHTHRPHHLDGRCCYTPTPGATKGKAKHCGSWSQVYSGLCFPEAAAWKSPYVSGMQTFYVHKV